MRMPMTRVAELLESTGAGAVEDNGLSMVATVLRSWPCESAGAPMSINPLDDDGLKVLGIPKAVASAGIDPARWMEAVEMRGLEGSLLDGSKVDFIGVLEMVLASMDAGGGMVPSQPMRVALRDMVEAHAAACAGMTFKVSPEETRAAIRMLGL